jgi:hypothetical protein
MRLAVRGTRRVLPTVQGLTPHPPQGGAKKSIAKSDFLPPPGGVAEGQGGYYKQQEQAKLVLFCE